MTRRRPFTLLAAFIFAVIALVHLYRIVAGFPVTIGAHAVGQGVSWVALVLSGLMAAMLLRESRG